MDIKEHGYIQIPISDYMELMATHTAFHDKSILVFYSPGLFSSGSTRYYTSTESEVLKKQYAEIEELQLEVARLSASVAQVHEVKKPFWKFW